MRLRSWAGGLTVFGLFYAIIIVALFVWQWPSIRDPNINLTPEKNLPEASQSFIYRILKSKSGDGSDDSPFLTLVPYVYPMQKTDPVVYLDTVRMANGHTIVFKADTPDQKIDEIARQYVEVLYNRHVQETTDTIGRLLLTLFVPIFTVAVFAWGGNKLWSAIQNLD